MSDWIDKHIKSQKPKTMDIMCCNKNCNLWLHPVNVLKNPLGQHKCKVCKGSMKYYSENVARDDKRRIDDASKDEIYSKRFGDEIHVNKKKVFYSDEYGWSFPGKYILLAIPALIGLGYFENTLILIFLMLYLFGCIIGFFKGDR